MLRLFFAFVMFGAVLWIGIFILKALARPVPPPPPPGEMRRINARYRCGNCGTELKMTLAPEEEPLPPRHCQEEMELVVTE